MHDVIEHLASPKNIFDEINRVLKMGGLLIIKTHDWRTTWKTFYNDPTRKRPYTEETLKKLFMMYGMKIRRFEHSGGTLPWKKEIILAIAQRMKQ